MVEAPKRGSSPQQALQLCDTVSISSLLAWEMRLGDVAGVENA